MTNTLPKPKLSEDALYLIGDRFAHASARCAGSTALYSGRGLNGERVSRVTPADVAEWASYGMGPLCCECGEKVATVVGGAVVVVDA